MQILRSVVFFLCLSSLLPIQGIAQGDTITRDDGSRYISTTRPFTYKWPYLQGHIPRLIALSGSLESFKHPIYSYGVAIAPWNISVYPPANPAFCGFEMRIKTNSNNQISGWDAGFLISGAIGFGFTYGRLFENGHQTSYFSPRISIGSGWLNISLAHRFFNWNKNKVSELHHTYLSLNTIIPVIRLSKKQSTETIRQYLDE